MIPFKDDNPTRSTPVVTIALIIINIVVFFVELIQGRYMEGFILELAAIPYEVTHLGNLPHSTHHSPLVTLITSMFLHAGLLHIAGNMLYLWIFGNNIEDTLGHFHFILFYIITGLAASLLHIIINPSSTVPMVGASGAISGVLGAYLFLFPRARVHTLIFLGFFIQVVKLPAAFVLVFWFIIQVINGLPSMGMGALGGVAWFAHIGGFVAGFLWARHYAKRRRRRFFA